MPGIDKDIIGKAADWIGQAADAAGKQLGHDERQESAELAGKIIAAVIARLAGAGAPLVAGASPSAGEFGGAVDELIGLARSA